MVCGVQGSGKSHTVSVILENMLIPQYSPIGMTEKAVAGLVLHYGEGGASALPNETAWLGHSSVSGVQVPPVHVYVSQSSLQTMRKVYAPLGNNVHVEPFLLSESELDAEAFQAMMAVGSSDSAPLYVQTIRVSSMAYQTCIGTLTCSVVHPSRSWRELHICGVPARAQSP